jgi:hypothetical protein
MSCGLAIAAALLLGDTNVALAAAGPQFEADTPPSVAGEPFFSDLVQRASVLKALTDSWAASGAVNQAGFFTGEAFTGFKTQAGELAARDMQGHLILKERGADGDLKCILRGISEDMPGRVTVLESAASAEERAVALAELSHLFEDNVEVITAPPAPEV